MTELRIVADENIPAVRELFAHLGSVVCYPGRDLTKELCQGADILLVRSVTRVDADLLAGTGVRFVGSATIGIDHLDTAYLEQQGVAWANAPGSNADSVVDYVISVLCRLDGALRHLLRGASVGIIGMGNVGSRLYRRLQRMGVTCCAYDPLLAADCFPILASLDEVLAADVICVHAPLTRGGPHPSYHLLDATRLQALRPGTTLVNAGRGGVVDNAALLSVLQQRQDISVVLDVWEHEPTIDLELMKRVDLATPHIAGYSYDGKLAGTRMIHRACCDALGLAGVSSAATAEPAVELTLRPRSQDASVLRDAVLAVYDVAADDQRLRGALLQAGAEGVGGAFDRLRRDYPRRREFSGYRIANAAGLAPTARGLLAAAGFQLPD